VRLSDHANSVGLRPLRHRFPTGGGDPFDDNWLVIGGSVTTPHGGWSFADACLLTHEARAVAVRLRAVAAGTVAVSGPGADGEPSPDREFVEPVLAFGLAGRDESGAVLRVHLAHEGAPPRRRGHDGADPSPYPVEPRPYLVEVRMDTAALLYAAGEWDRALVPFPDR
jgi:hypothetical protein